MRKPSDCLITFHQSPQPQELNGRKDKICRVQETGKENVSPQRDSNRPPNKDGTREDPKRGGSQIPRSSSLGVGGHHYNHRGDLHHT